MVLDLQCYQVSKLPFASFAKKFHVLSNDSTIIIYYCYYICEYMLYRHGLSSSMEQDSRHSNLQPFAVSPGQASTGPTGPRPPAGGGIGWKMLQQMRCCNEAP